MKKLRIVLAQLNMKVGDLEGNLQKHIQAAVAARDEHAADVIVFPELSLIGYPAEDLLLRPGFIRAATHAFKKLMQEIHGIHCLVGHPHVETHHLYNVCSLIYNGQLLGRYAKQRLPNYGVFDEYRYFTPGDTSCIVSIHGVSVGFVICEDVWRLDPVHEAAEHGADLILCPNASPFEANKHEQRIAVLSRRAKHNGVPIVYVNQVGGQDELVFDGGSVVMNAEGQLETFVGFFNERLVGVDIAITKSPAKSEPLVIHDTAEERIYHALVLGLRDYVRKNGFSSVLLGVSGGIDSALTAAIAVDALGADKVHAVVMPSRFTAPISLEDANALVTALGIHSRTISIEPTYQQFLETLAPVFSDKKVGVTEENIQARCRAVILLALSNKEGHLLLTTGNRSELATGYCTLYGDMAGGFAVLKDILKTEVYALAAYRNGINPIIPKRTIDRAPTAELSDDQKDEDTLPPYPILDGILDSYLNHNQSVSEIIRAGYDKVVVRNVVDMIHRNEYKRRQAAPGPHIRHKSFIRDWRYPITNGFKD
ncbi:MAG TPA: NAD+ synthase [Gammaproteobacteria bacterium]|jgi:NAD+ synthase (glutamine-hydrolysing)|nr:NAD+ synthase [Gammaproteobacteria bacterium]